MAAVSTIVRVNQRVDDAARRIVAAVEAEQAGNYLTLVSRRVALGDGIGQTTWGAAVERAAVGLVILRDAFPLTQFLPRVAALVDVGAVDEQRAAQQTKPDCG